MCNQNSSLVLPDTIVLPLTNTENYCSKHRAGKDIPHHKEDWSTCGCVLDIFLPNASRM